MNSKPFKMPYQANHELLEAALWRYYELCFPQFDEGDRYDLTRDALVIVEQTVRRLYVGPEVWQPSEEVKKIGEIIANSINSKTEPQP